MSTATVRKPTAEELASFQRTKLTPENIAKMNFENDEGTSGVEPNSSKATVKTEPKIEPVLPTPFSPEEKASSLQEKTSKFDDKPPVAIESVQRPQYSYPKYTPCETSNMESIGLPSNFVPYGKEITSLKIRKFNGNDILKLISAVKAGDTSKMIDVIGGTINVDPRELTVEDFFFLMYHLRISSFPKSPYNITWRSRYGDSNKYQITNENLVVKQFQLNSEEYMEWMRQGLILPTMRDFELLDMYELTEDEKWLFERAQFVAGNSFDEKLETVRNADVELLEKIREFRELTFHGVENAVMLRNPKFNLDKAIDVMSMVLQGLQTSPPFTGKQEAIDKLVEELQEFQIAKAKGEEHTIVPALERVEITIQMLDFFPEI